MVDAPKKEFSHILGDKEQELLEMVLKQGDNLATFAIKFQILVEETGMKQEKAVRRFKAAVQSAAPMLAA